nr:T9SS type A sorting domain-containing protein [Bacteroidota bacterium]
GDLFIKYGLDGTYYGSFQAPGASNVRDLAYDGSYFYGSAASTTIFEMDFEVQVLVSTYTAPVVVRAIAYDDAEDGFWANNWSTDPTLFNRVGFIMNSFNINGDESFYGFAYMNNEIGVVLWGFSQTDNMNTIKRYNLPDGTWESDFDVTTILSLPVPGTDIAGGLFFAHDINPSFATLGGLVQNVCLWGIDMGFGCIHPDVGVTAITEPTSGVYLSASEPISFEIKNFGTNLIENLPYDVSWDAGYYEGIFAGPLSNGQSAEITLPVTADLTAFGDYTFEACVYLDGDMNPDNDCKTKVISCMEPFLCVDGLYSDGCINGDGLLNWNLTNINVPDIPCSGLDYDWYHDYTSQVHELQTGSNSTLTVQAGHNDTYFDVWIDLNDDLYYDSSELILNDAFCALENTDYQFSIFLPDSVSEGAHFLRYRTNWQAAVEESCESYPYGNCCDFSVIISSGAGDNWLEVSPISGMIQPGYMDTIFLDFNSAGLVPGDYLAELLINNNSTNNPELLVPVALTVIEAIEDPIIRVTPDSLAFEVYTDSLATDIVEISNIGGDTLDYEMNIAYYIDTDGWRELWLSVDPTSGSVAADDTNQIDVMVDATDLEEGDYFAHIVITSNDPITPVYECLVSLAVNDGCPLPPPINLVGEEVEPHTVYLTWDEPETSGKTLLWESQIDLPKVENPEYSRMVLDYLYFNVYRNNEMIATNVIFPQYIDYNVPIGYPEYVVSAVYEECESFSDTLFNLIITSIPENSGSTVLFYPNPANDFVLVKSGHPILEIGIMDNLGRRIYHRPVYGKFVMINTSSFIEGIYFVQIETTEATVIEKLLIKY